MAQHVLLQQLRNSMNDLQEPSEEGERVQILEDQSTVRIRETNMQEYIKNIGISDVMQKTCLHNYMNIKPELTDSTAEYTVPHTNLRTTAYALVHEPEVSPSETLYVEVSSLSPPESSTVDEHVCFVKTNREMTLIQLEDVKVNSVNISNVIVDTGASATLLHYDLVKVTFCEH